MRPKLLILKGKLSSAKITYNRCTTETGKLHYERVISGLVGEIRSVEALNVQS